MERKLRAIFSADVKGYSVLMANDDASTIQTLKDYREIMSRIIVKQHGRVVDAVGDNMLAEFESAVAAVQSAVQIQNKLKKKNADLPSDKQLIFRIGINIGDIIEDDKNLYGDGVNIAARIESIAEPGGICISRGVYDQVKKLLKLNYEYIGEHSVKNISEPVRVYKISIHSNFPRKVTPNNKIKMKNMMYISIGVLCCFVFVILGGLYWNYFYLPVSGNVDPKSSLNFDLPKGPSIAVLPFDNMTGDKEQEVFCDGITENIIFALSHVKGLFVIASNSSFSYKGKSIKVQQIGRELAVQYLIDGSIQIFENNIRIIAQLIDTNTGHNIWSEIYNRPLKNLFKTQDEIIIQICEAMQINITEGETVRNRFKGINDINVGVKLLKAISKLRYGYSRDNVLSGLNDIQEVIEINPNIPQAYVLSAAYNLFAIQWRLCEQPLFCFGRATESIKKAFTLDEENSDSHMIAAYLLLLKKEHEKAINEMKIAISINPNNGDAYAGLGFILSYAGRPKEGISLIEKAIQIDPLPPIMYLYQLGVAHYESQEYEKGLKIFKKVLYKNKDHFATHVRMAASYATLGNLEEAKKSASEVLRVKPDFTINSFVGKKPYKNTEDRKRHWNNLSLSGLPE